MLSACFGLFGFLVFYAFSDSEWISFLGMYVFSNSHPILATTASFKRGPFACKKPGQSFEDCVTKITFLLIHFQAINYFLRRHTSIYGNVVFKQTVICFCSFCTLIYICIVCLTFFKSRGCSSVITVMTRGF